MRRLPCEKEETTGAVSAIARYRDKFYTAIVCTAMPRRFARRYAELCFISHHAPHIYGSDDAGEFNVGKMRLNAL